jgi:hypothetical protein
MGQETNMRPCIHSVIAITLGLVCAVPAAAERPDEAAIGEAIAHYFQGQATGDGEHYRQAFHPDAKLFFVQDGKVVQWTLEEYVGRSPGKPAADEAKRKRGIDSIDIAGDAAVVKVSLDYPTVRFTDYMSMLEVDGRWWIVNKTFHRQARP